MVRRAEAPLYDPRFEHDACGIGFVADAGGRSVGRVLPLALAGLAALGHRGAFGADGKSSDGAGVALPLEAAVVERLAPGLDADRPGILQLFLPRGRTRSARARGLVLTAIAEARLDLIRWRAVPADPDALGVAAAASRPAFAQAMVARPEGDGDAAFEPGGTGAISPLSSIKYVGAPWELGLAEVHQVLLRNELRDRVVLRMDGGLQTGRDLLMAALLGAEEFAFGTAALVAIGCDMARQCHLDTCPTGIATQREDLRAKFTGTPEQVERFAFGVAEDLRRELAAVGARSVGEVVGEARRLSRAGGRTTHDLGPVLRGGAWPAGAERRANPASAGASIARGDASVLETHLVRALASQGSFTASGLSLTTADRSFGAALAGAIERGEVQRPIQLELHGSAGQSFGEFATDGLSLRLVGQANDYVGKGLSGGTVVVVPEPDLGTIAQTAAIAGNACLYGATAGRLHLVGRAEMRFAVRNSGAQAVVEGIGPHGCEYMTGGTVVVLGPVGANFGAGMTGGLAYLYDPAGRHVAALHEPSVRARRLASVAADRPDGAERLAEWRRLVEAHRDAGSAIALSILAEVGRGMMSGSWSPPRPAKRQLPARARPPAPASPLTARPHRHRIATSPHLPRRRLPGPAPVALGRDPPRARDQLRLCRPRRPWRPDNVRRVRLPAGGFTGRRDLPALQPARRT